MEASRARVLVVANRTAESPELLHVLRERAAEGPVAYTLVVPASAHGMAWATDMHAGEREAKRHLRRAVAAIKEVS